MYCHRCGFDNNPNSQFCEKCGEPLNVNPSFNRPQYNNYQKSDNKWVIIAITLIVLAVIVAGTIIYISGSDNTNDVSGNSFSSNNVQENSVNTVNTGSSESTTEKSTTSSSSLRIISGSFNTGSSLSDKTYITVYVGKEHAGENVKIKVLYTRDGSQLNPGNIVSKTVDSSGYFTMRSANAFKYYPDHAYVILYDANENVVDTRDITMSPTSGTQTF